MNTPTPILFVKRGCPYCRATMEYLDAKSVSYEQIEVRSDPEKMKQLEAVSGQNRTPTMVLGNDVLADFGVEQLEPFLKQHQLI